jgi:DNA-binding response OmpR family regulator
VVARVRAVLRRAGASQTPGEVIRVGRLTLDLGSRRARVDNAELVLTVSEFDILVALSREAGRVLTRLQLLEATQGVAYEGYERSIDQHIKNIRRKIEEGAEQARLIQTVHGVGYRLEEG